MSMEGWLRAAWRHEFAPDRSIEASFIAAPGFNFAINGAAAVSDMAKIDAGGKISLTHNIEAFANFDGEFAPSAHDLSGTMASSSGGRRIRRASISGSHLTLGSRLQRSPMGGEPPVCCPRRRGGNRRSILWANGALPTNCSFVTCPNVEIGLSESGE